MKKLMNCFSLSADLCITLHIYKHNRKISFMPSRFKISGIEDSAVYATTVGSLVFSVLPKPIFDRDFVLLSKPRGSSKVKTAKFRDI